MSDDHTQNNPRKINGSPTKELFVHILTRDLSLEDAINDLIDNCIDGAKRLRPNKKYDGLYVEIIINEDSFSIKDNCGGIPIDLARQYAFRFGRADDMPPTDYSIGQFGVGMKRAIFKLGTAFYVHSKSEKSEFAIAVDINDWLAKKQDWSFEFKEDFKENESNNPEETETYIEVTPIHSDLKQRINNKSFIDDLRRSIEEKHMQNIYQGIQISLNGVLLKSKRPEFIISNEIKIASQTKTHRGKNGDVKVEIKGGIGKDILEEGGWYIFCNDRLLLGPEQTALTGWTGRGNGGVAHYHGQYKRFRGLVYFSAENAKDLPWNTSKNGIDASSPIFLNTRGRMIDMMRPIIRFLNEMKKERESAPDGSENTDRPYEQIVKASKTVNIANLKEEYFNATFIIPDLPPKEEKIDSVKISYSRPKSLAKLAKKNLSATSWKQLGEMTFDYYVNMEEIEDE